MIAILFLVVMTISSAGFLGYVIWHNYENSWFDKNLSDKERFVLEVIFQDKWNNNSESLLEYFQVINLLVKFKLISITLTESTVEFNCTNKGRKVRFYLEEERIKKVRRD